MQRVPSFHVLAILSLAEVEAYWPMHETSLSQCRRSVFLGAVEVERRAERLDRVVIYEREVEMIEVASSLYPTRGIGALLPHSRRRLGAAILSKVHIRAVKSAAVLVPVLVHQVAFLVANGNQISTSTFTATEISNREWPEGLSPAY